MLKNNLSEIKKEFPILNQKINDYPLVYLDNAASTQKPINVIDKIQQVYTKTYANVHRGIHTLSEISTTQLEDTRKVVANFINTKNTNSIIFTKGTTDSLNKISFGLKHLIASGDEILLTVTEHHANLVCWQQVSKITNAKLKFIDIDKNFKLNLSNIKTLITPKTKILSLTHISNVLGSINDVKKIINIAKKINPEIITIVDAAQSIAHLKIDINELNCDFLVFSSHKMYGPSGVGIMYIKEKFFDVLEPTEFGGNMIENVFLEESTFGKAPFKFEAGTPNITDIIAFKEAILFIQNIGFDKIISHEIELNTYFIEKIKKIDDFLLVGSTDINNRIGVFSFQIKNIHPHDLSTFLDNFGIAIRSGHHCAMPLHAKLNISSTSRVSFGIYNTKEDIEIFFNSLEKIITMHKTGKFIFN